MADEEVPDVVTPFTIGPTWRRGPEGKFVLPEFTLGWHCLAWSATYLQHYVGAPWRYTAEQARLTLWWYAVDPLTNRFVWRDGVIQRLKGWGKDPLVSTWSAFEFVGPCRPSGQVADEGNDWGIPAGQPIGMQHPAAWVQIAAVSQDQTRNTMTLFPSILTKRAIEEYRIDLGKEIIYADKGRARIEAVTSSPRALEGGRPTNVNLGETHHWVESNGGHEMAAVIERNATKSADGQARTLANTNAFEPGEDSVAERTRDAYESIEARKRTGVGAVDIGLFYDSLEAPAEAKLTEAWIVPTLMAVRGDSTWLDIERLKASILDVRNPPSRSRRFWFNQITAAEDAYLAPYEWDACPHEGIDLQLGEEIVLFFDGSKSDDATGLMGCRLSDGHLVTFGVWQKPANWPEGTPWRVPRDQVDGVVDNVFAQYKPIAFFADPGAGQDDADGERYWDGYVDAWAQRYGKRLKLKAVASGHAQHAVMWDMRDRRRQETFTTAVDRFYRDVLERQLTHDGHKVLRQHVANARRRTNAWGYTIGKEHRESARKIDLVVCAIGARMLRRMVMNSTAWTKRSTVRGKGRVVVLR